MGTFLIAVGVIAIVGAMFAWIWSAARRTGAARDSAAGYLAGHEAAYYTADYSSSSHDCGTSAGDAGCGDGGAG